MARHDLFAVLGQRSLAVGGVLRGPDGVVFGRRPDRAIYQAGEWQLPPPPEPWMAAPSGRRDGWT